MIVGHIEQRETFSYLPAAVQRSLAFLASTNLEELPLGRHEIEGDDIFANVMAFETADADSKLHEVHRDYLDVQYLIEGQERIGFGLASETHTVEKPYDAENDFWLSGPVDGESEVVMAPGMFAIFLPNQPHKPGLHCRRRAGNKESGREGSPPIV